MGETPPESGEKIVSLGSVFTENEAYAKTLDADGIFSITGSFQTFHEGRKHFPVGETDGGFHGEGGRSGETTHQKGGEPPVASGIADAVFSFTA